LDENEIFAIAIYTHELKNKGNQEENFYFQLNQMLRKRSPSEYEKWRGYLFYLQNALNKLENQKMTVYRGIPLSEKEIISKEYTLNRPIHWSGFSSSNISKAKNFAKNGILMCINIFSGKIIKDYSIFKTEYEVLLSPNSKFIVSKLSYIFLLDGCSYLRNILSQNGEILVFYERKDRSCEHLSKVKCRRTLEQSDDGFHYIYLEEQQKDAFVF